MADANTAAFLDGGSSEFANPFQSAPSTGPSSDPNDQPNPANPGSLSNNEMWRRQDALRTQGQATANVNAPGLANRATPEGLAFGSPDGINQATGYVTPDYAKRHPKARPSVMRNIISDPWTLGVLSAPYAVVGGGAAVGGAAALGLGEAAAAGGTAGAAGAAGAEAASAAAASNAATAGGVATGAAVPAAAGGAAAAAPAVAGGAAAAAPAAAGGITAGNVIDAAGLAGTLAIAALDQRKTAAEKALLAKQEQMAAEAKQRQQQMQTAGMNALGQRLLAFNPQNQMMAKMYGPEAAFAPEQFAAMAENPMKPPPLDPQLAANGGQGDPAKEAQIAQWKAQQAQFQQEEEKRRQMIMSGISPVGSGPAPLQQRAPQAARKF